MYRRSITSYSTLQEVTSYCYSYFKVGNFSNYVTVTPLLPIPAETLRLSAAFRERGRDGATMADGKQGVRRPNRVARQWRPSSASRLQFGPERPSRFVEE